MYVWDIAFSQKDYGPGGSFHDLMTTVTIQSDSDGDGVAESGDSTVSDASVSITLTHDTDGDGAFECGTPDDNCENLGGTTDSSGQVTFTLKRCAHRRLPGGGNGCEPQHFGLEFVAGRRQPGLLHAAVVGADASRGWLPRLIRLQMRRSKRGRSRRAPPSRVECRKAAIV